MRLQYQVLLLCLHFCNGAILNNSSGGQPIKDEDASDRLVLPNSKCQGSVQCCMEGHGCNTTCTPSHVDGKGLSLLFHDVDESTFPDVKVLTKKQRSFDTLTDHKVTVNCSGQTNKLMVEPFTVRYYRYNPEKYDYLRTAPKGAKIENDLLKITPGKQYKLCLDSVSKRPNYIKENFRCCVKECNKSCQVESWDNGVLTVKNFSWPGPGQLPAQLVEEGETPPEILTDTIFVQCASPYGPGLILKVKYPVVPTQQANMSYTVIGIVSAVILTGAVVLGTLYNSKSKRPQIWLGQFGLARLAKSGQMKLKWGSKMSIDEYNVETRPLADCIPWATEDILHPFSSLRFDPETPIGKGNYGEVFRGTFTPEGCVSPLDVAIKTANSQSGLKDLAKEAEIMARLNGYLTSSITFHDNVINMQGIVHQSLPDGEKLYLVLEFCSKGDLKKYLTSHKRAITKDCYSQLLHMASCCGHQDPSMLEEYLGLRNHGTINGSNEERAFEMWVDNLFDIADYPPNMSGAGFGLLFSWSKQIAEGMRFVCAQGRGIFHGDLAARNILLTDKKVAKVSDFGLAHWLVTQEGNHVQGQVPIRWMAPELKITAEGDVYNYAVLLWEIFTLGELPYSDISAEGVNRRFEQGDVPELAKPRLCPPRLYNLMLDCWAVDKDQRPTFEQIVQRLDAFILSTNNSF